ncbi:MAG: molecular chaperone HtpG [Anaerolineae bacterium]|nr:molecular chaperone HtpG [Anaerolineae bacterium]
MAETFTFKAEIQQLLNILIYSLYTEREIFLRELLSNASDALHRLQFEMHTAEAVYEPEAELAVYITVNKEANTITVRDTGVGMTRDELITNLGTIAQSGASAFLQALKEKGDAATNIIGQFGVGFYSVFMVASRVEVTSRSYLPSALPARWTCDGSPSFMVEELRPEQMPHRGTAITITLKEDATEFADEWRLRQIIKRHSDFIAFPIYVGQPAEGEAPRPANQQTALWRQSPQRVEAEAYRSFYRQITLDTNDPLTYVHISSEAPLDLHAILYVPARRDRGPFAPRDHGLRLYSRKILIQERTPDLLPEYLRFVEGVVDSEDLPLNVSRESVQSNAFMRKVSSNLVRRLLRHLEEMAVNEPDRYRTLWEQFGPFLKEGVATSPGDHQYLLKLLRFHSSRTGPQDWVSLAEYVARMAKGQDKIYYLFGEDLASITRSPHLDPFRASDIEVLYLTEPIDSFMMMALRDYEGHAFQSIADAHVDMPAAPESTGEMLTDALFDPLLKRFNEVLAERVIVVREAARLTESPVRLVVPDDVPGVSNLDRVRRYVDENFQAGKRVMEINRRHPLIRNLAQALQANPLDALIPAVIEQLFENALLLEGLHPNPAEMVGRIQTIMAAATESRSQEAAIKEAGGPGGRAGAQHAAPRQQTTKKRQPKKQAKGEGQAAAEEVTG